MERYTVHEPGHPALIYKCIGFGQAHDAAAKYLLGNIANRAAKVDQDLAHAAQFVPGSYDAQGGSPLFRLSEEIRAMIFELVLCGSEDASRPYEWDDPDRRPGFYNHQSRDLALLRTCQRIYAEAWSIPLTKTTHVVFLHEPKPLQKPPRAELRPAGWKRSMEKALTQTHLRHQSADQSFSIRHVHVVAQAENLFALSTMLDLPFCHIRSITVTVRHQDWNEPSHRAEATLRLQRPYDPEAEFRLTGTKYKVPESVSNLRFELETVARKKETLNDLVAQIRENWVFQRSDETYLVPGPGPVKTMEWKGSSYDDSFRRLCDEVEPGVAEYYVAFVDFIPGDSPLESASVVSSASRTGHAAVDSTRDLRSEVVAESEPSDWGAIPLGIIEEHGISRDDSAEQALRKAGGSFIRGVFVEDELLLHAGVSMRRGRVVRNHGGAKIVTEAYNWDSPDRHFGPLGRPQY